MQSPHHHLDHLARLTQHATSTPSQADIHTQECRLRHKTGRQIATTTPPVTRKRKLDNSSIAPASKESLSLQPKRKASKTSNKGSIEAAEAALPATPQTLASDKQMDSDDDFNSVMSGSDDGFGDDDQDSSVDFGGGECHLM